jgi:hypothetical protein
VRLRSEVARNKLVEPALAAQAQMRVPEDLREDLVRKRPKDVVRHPVEVARGRPSRGPSAAKTPPHVQPRDDSRRSANSDPRR